MHLKNFSLITREDKIELSPAYDILNSTIALANPQEEFALPIMGKKRKISSNILIDYYGRKRLELNDQSINKVIKQIEYALPLWEQLINNSFLDSEMKDKYFKLVEERKNLLFSV
jgi:serine/threonine-protein kinase HipA